MKNLISLVTLFAFASTCYAIRCYECNSHNETECKSITPGARSKFLIDCDSIEDGHKYTLCRKIDMYLDADFGEMHKAENRVHRACGYIDVKDGRACYYKSGYKTRSWICTCYTDDCNAGESLAPFLGLVTATLIGVVTTRYIDFC